MAMDLKLGKKLVLVLTVYYLSSLFSNELQLNVSALPIVGKELQY